jgi:hypothetical protein
MDKKINQEIGDISIYQPVPWWVRFTDPAPEILLRLLDDNQIREFAIIQMDMKIKIMENELESKINKMESEISLMKQAIEINKDVRSMMKQRG